MVTAQTVFERRVAALLLALLAAGATAAPASEPAVSTTETTRYLVQAATLALARQDVEQVGGKVERNLDVIHAVSAYLDASQAARLRARSDVRIFADRRMHTAAWVHSWVR